MNKFCISLLVLLFIIIHSPADADMNRVYHPYVEQNERELEYGFTLRDLNGERELLNRLGAGYTWNDKIFTEVYLLAESLTHEETQVKGYEIEIKIQLTEQGEYWADWGLLFEAETAKDINSHEWAAGILWEKEISHRWVAASNLMVGYEYGSDIKNEFETALRGQLRYRHSNSIEPAFEFYLDDQDWAAGPALMGSIKLSGRKQLRWELGLLFGLDTETPENSLRGGIEFEF
jgi:hypothetical protein